MTKRPWILTALALILTAASASLPVQVMAIYGHGITELDLAIGKLTTLNWAVLFSLLALAGAVFRASRWTRLAAPACLGAVAANNFAVGYYATDYSPATAAIATAGFAVLLLPLTAPGLRALFTHPERRWWLRAQRKRVCLRLAIDRPSASTLLASTFDVSETGAFVPLTTLKAQDPRAPGRALGPEERVTIRMSLGNGEELQYQGRVVRRSEPRGMYPSGLGIEFVDMPAFQRLRLKNYLSTHVEISM